MSGNLPEPNCSSLRVAQSHRNLERRDSHQENAGWSSKVFVLNLWSISHWKVQVLFVLGTLEPAFLGPEVSIISFSGDTSTLFSFPLGLQSQSTAQVLLIPPVILILLLLMFLLLRRTPVLPLKTLMYELPTPALPFPEHHSTNSRKFCLNLATIL